MQLRGSRAAVVQRTCRPFDVETLGAALQACKALALVAKSQVQALRELCEEGEEVATNHLGYQISRDRRGQLGWTQCLERCGVDAGSRDAIRGWLFRKSGERRGAFFLDIVELRRWVGGHHA